MKDIPVGRTWVVISGSTRGLGLCFAKEFLSGGSAVMISGRTASSVETALPLLKGEFPNAELHGFPCDVADSSQSEALWREAQDGLGGLDHWILNAGIGQPIKPIWEIEPGFVESVLAIDLLGPLYGAWVAMRGGQGGRRRGADRAGARGVGPALPE
jgi:NAD(P)-dependent dehydrogenase (short-subunit alcohol dehydrogenase family)